MLTQEEIFERLENEIPINSNKGYSNDKYMVVYFRINKKEIKYILDDFNNETLDTLIKKIKKDIKESE